MNKLIEYTPVFTANRKAYYSGQYRCIVNQGSSRSSKTYSIVQLLITICQQEKKSISICGASLPHLKRGARRDFLEIMEDWGIFHEDSFNRTDNIYNFPNGAYIEFFGADDAGKVRGPGRDILFMNEANLVGEKVYRQLAIRTREIIFMDLNPADEESYVYTIADAPGNKFIHSTYKNNLKFITQEQVKEIESLKDADENLWRVFGLGLRGTSTSTIYKHWKPVKELPEGGVEIYGLDFGFNNPTALVRVKLHDNDIYAEELLHRSQLTNQDLLGQLATLIPNKRVQMFADAAEPQRIEELYRAGYNVKGADKSVKDGIDRIRRTRLFILNSSANLIKEIKSYKYMEDKEGKILEEPVKMNDHLLDAMRYAVHTYYMKPSGVYAIR